MILGYNTNGMAHHALLDAIDLLDEIGYQSVAITLDHGVLSPRDPDRDVQRQLASLRNRLRALGMRSVIETGARFLLDPRHKHEPTLVTADALGRAQRIEFYRHAIRQAAALRSDCVSLWSGILRDTIPRRRAMARLAAGLEEVLDFAAAEGVSIAFEPEPGMLVDSMRAYQELLDVLSPGHAEKLRLTLDIGHLHCQDETPPGDYIRAWAERLVNVHVEDMRRGTHEHLMFGDGQIDFPPILQSLGAIGYEGGIHVELSRHAHEAPTAARRAMKFLRPLVPRD